MGFLVYEKENLGEPILNYHERGNGVLVIVL